MFWISHAAILPPRFIDFVMQGCVLGLDGFQASSECSADIITNTGKGRLRMRIWKPLMFLWWIETSHGKSRWDHPSLTLESCMSVHSNTNNFGRKSKVRFCVPEKSANTTKHRRNISTFPSWHGQHFSRHAASTASTNQIFWWVSLRANALKLREYRCERQSIIEWMVLRRILIFFIEMQVLGVASNFR